MGMGRRYSGVSNATNTVSTTVPMYAINGSTSTRGWIYEWWSGSDATPADAATKLSFQRSSAAGTSSSTVTPNPFDPADPASLFTYVTAWSVNPTITANSALKQIPENQRATIRWAADPYGEMVIPATSGAGIVLMSVVASATANFPWTTSWLE